LISTPDSPKRANHHELLVPDVAVGDEVPVFTLPLTLQRLVMEAGVNRDFTPLHHDDEDTRLTGAPRSYANTMLIQAFIEATLRTWMGDRGRLRELAIRMVSFNLSETLVAAGGTVTAIDPPVDLRADVHLAIWMRSDDTPTVTGSAIVSLPTSAAHAVTEDGHLAGGDADRRESDRAS
jgi:acyl dehydratase